MLRIDHLRVKFANTEVVRGVSYTIKPGEIVSILGESGSGKTVSALAPLGLYNKHLATVSAEQIILGDINLLKVSEKQMNTIRGKRVGMVFQNPGEALSPHMSIKAQFKELTKVHGIKWDMDSVLKVLDEVGLGDDADRVLEMMPYQLSGGQAQRVTIALTLFLSPEIIIADEPTSSIDASLTEVIVSLLLETQKKRNLGLLFITHDFELASRISDRMIILYGGLVMEEGSCQQIFHGPKHPYTIELMRCVNALRTKSERLYTLNGYALDPTEFTAACPFAARCPVVEKQCHEGIPKLREVTANHHVRCVRAEGVTL